MDMEYTQERTKIVPLCLKGLFHLKNLEVFLTHNTVTRTVMSKNKCQQLMTMIHFQDSNLPNQNTHDRGFKQGVS
jgi:hypothetical protein